jgi:hypothetical protein
MIDYSNVPEDQFEKVFANISDAILHYQYWDRDSHFFNSCCIHCGTIRYYDIPMDFYLVKKDCYELLFCKDCFEEIEKQHMKRGIRFEVEFYCYEEIIKEIESPDLDSI